MRILVVEDERKVAGFIRQGLEEEGYAVELAHDGAAALDLLVDGPPPDLVVLDLMLPRAGPHASGAGRARVGPRLRPGEQHHRRLRRLSAAEDRHHRRAPAAPHGARGRVRAAGGRSVIRWRAPASIHTRLTLWYTSV